MSPWGLTPLFVTGEIATLKRVLKDKLLKPKKIHNLSKIPQRLQVIPNRVGGTTKIGPCDNINTVYPSDSPVTFRAGDHPKEYTSS